MNKTLSYISSAVNGTMSKTANGERMLCGFFTDSRTPSSEKLFLALRGERVDGNSFVPALAEQGFAVMTDREESLNLNGDIIYVPDVRTALQDLSKYYRQTEMGNIPFVGITGSVGKTTTKDMVALALSGEMKVHKTQGNFNSQIGLPQTILAAEPNVDCAVVELGMSFKGEMERISCCAIPNISIITNIGYSHIENLGSREAIRDEKLNIAKFSPENSVLLLNGDEPLLRNINANGKKLFYVSAVDRNCDCYAENITETETGLSFVASIFNNKIPLTLEVRGTHFVINSLFALATASLLGLTLQAAANSLSTYKSDGKRQHIYNANGHTVISDCYNASPESMKAALSVLSTYKTRRIAVLGDMLELGNETENLHNLVGEYTNFSADVLIGYGDLAIHILNNSSVSEKYYFKKEQREELLNFLKAYIKDNDVVLYKSSNGMNLSELIV